MMNLNVEEKVPQCEHRCALVYSVDTDTDEKLFRCAKGTEMGPTINIEAVIRV